MDDEKHLKTESKVNHNPNRSRYRKKNNIVASDESVIEFSPPCDDTQLLIEVSESPGN
jgi:hypothetical protein